MIVCSLCNCESRRNCSPRGSGGPFSRCISRTQNSDGTWALSKLSCTTPILIESIIFWRCPLNNSCWEDLIHVALTNGYSLVIDMVATVCWYEGKLKLLENFVYLSGLMQRHFSQYLTAFWTLLCLILQPSWSAKEESKAFHSSSDWAVRSFSTYQTAKCLVLDIISLFIQT